MKLSFEIPKKSTTVITSFNWCLHREKSFIVCKQTSGKVSVAMMEQDSCLDIESVTHSTFLVGDMN